MATYTDPGPEQISGWTGVTFQAVARKGSDFDFDGLIAGLLDNARSEVAQVVGIDRFKGSGHTDEQVITLQEAVANGVAWRFLRNPQIRQSTGTQLPYKLPPGVDIADVIEQCQITSRNLARLVASGTSGNADALILTSATDADTLPVSDPGSSRVFGVGRTDLW